ncbi:MAG: cellulase family glycosylhydrolase [Anaerolineae bacterium]|jgi:hypothetical protein|nr:cellulase family glycosylhydrolase [Anaerolineae bacterium]
MNRLILPLIGLLLCACGGRPLIVVATPTPPVPQYCRLHVEGRWVKDARGEVIILHGAELPTLSEMEAGDREPSRRLSELARAGARVVRLPIDQSEITPTFVPAVVSPFVDQANALGILVILAYRNDLQETVRDQGEAAEDWLRLALTYLRNAPGVWFQPFERPIPTPKWQAMNQRMLDVVRGFRADNVVVVHRPDWLRQAPRALLNGSNVVYSVTDLSGWPLDGAPFIRAAFDGRDAPAVEAAQVWSIAAEDAPLEVLAPLWQRSRVCG